MSKVMPELDLNFIEELISRHSDGLSRQEIYAQLSEKIPKRTLQRHLKLLVDREKLITQGAGRFLKYRSFRPSVEKIEDPELAISNEGKEIQNYVTRPLSKRKAVGYNREFLDSYIPNETSYLSDKTCVHLKKMGSVAPTKQAAGTYARTIFDRLLIDLSWNSSRLEGNTYSLLDTKRLIAFGEEANGKDRFEAQMILNHKDAIQFLIDSAQEIGLNRYTLLNLHGLLANNLLSEPLAEGRLRKIVVMIGGSVFHPLEVPQLIEECFQQILETACAIRDSFEQAFFLMVHLPYLQPFDDVNKRVSRLAANIPLIKENLIPLAFLDLPTELYLQATLGVYELNKVDLLKDVFIWSYERSVERYAAVRQSLGEPDPFRLKHREALRHLVSDIVKMNMGRSDASAHINKWSRENVPSVDLNQFIETAETEILGLHDGNFARYRIRPSEFQSWWTNWEEK